MNELNHFEKMESYIPVDLATYQGIFSAIGVISLFIVGRYFLFVLPFYKIFWLNQNTSKRSLHDKKLKPGQIRLEIQYSLISSLIFALSGCLIGFVWQKGFSKIYLRFDEFPYWYMPLSFVLITIVHELYFYWTHRWMHLPKVFRAIHSIHHFSRNTSPWASFSFHPGETLIQAAFLPLFVMVVPLHPVVLILYLTFMTITAISNHLGVELINSRLLGSWFISGTHHSLHHEKYSGNFGLYFRFVDQAFGTEIEADTSSDRPRDFSKTEKEAL